MRCCRVIRGVHKRRAPNARDVSTLLAESTTVCLAMRSSHGAVRKQEKGLSFTLFLGGFLLTSELQDEHVEVTAPQCVRRPSPVFLNASVLLSKYADVIRREGRLPDFFLVHETPRSLNSPLSIFQLRMGGRGWRRGS